MVNPDGYNIRLFPLYVKPTDNTEQKAIRLGTIICNNINLYQKYGKTTIDTTNFFWLPGKNAVWSDVLGENEAFNALLRETKTANAFPGYFEQNKTTIFTYFRRGTISASLAQALHAPTNQVATTRTKPNQSQLTYKMTRHLMKIENHLLLLMMVKMMMMMKSMTMPMTMMTMMMMMMKMIIIIMKMMMMRKTASLTTPTIMMTLVVTIIRKTMMTKTRNNLPFYEFIHVFLTKIKKLIAAILLKIVYIVRRI